MLIIQNRLATLTQRIKNLQTLKKTNFKMIEI